MRVMPIDQSQSGLMGLAIVDVSDGTHSTIIATHLETYRDEHGKLIPTKNHHKRCRRFAKVVYAYYQQYKPDVVMLEIVRVFHQGKPDPFTMMRLSEIQGVLYVVIPESVPIYLANVSSWQKETLHGKRGENYKQLSMERVQRVYGLVLSEHEADAINMADALPTLLQRQAAGASSSVIIKV